jgi:hypothetical protein
MRLALAVVVVAACGSSGSKSPAPIGNHAGSATRQELAIAKLHELAAAIRADGPVATLGDPTDGIWLWEQPGVAPKPTVHAKAGDARPLSRLLADGGLDGARADGWRRGLADAIEHGLAALDVDGDPAAPAHNVDCGGANGMTPATRAVLRTHDVSVAKDYASLEYDELKSLTAPLGFRFDFNQVQVYLAERDGALYVAHLVVSTPCEA